jgi:glycosyltransferase involved in cell wall biosynthesis
VSYFIKSLLAALKLPKPDVVIATSPQIFCGYAGVWYKRLRHVPLVIEIRDIWPESMGAVGAKIPSVAYWMLEKIERTMYRKCDRLVTVGEGYRVRLMEKGVPEDKISVIMNGTDLEVYKPGPRNEALLEKYGLKDKFVVSYIGTVGMACGLEVVLAAAEIFSHKEHEEHKVMFVVVGDGAYREKLEAEAKKRGLENVVFTGRQPKESMPDWINSSDASLVHLKKTELFTTVMPSKIFESAGCMKPIIMGVDGYAKKLVLDAEAGLDMKPENAESLVACVRRLAGDPELCRQLGENAYRNIAQIHNRDRQAEEYLEIIRTI